MEKGGSSVSWTWRDISTSDEEDVSLTILIVAFSLSEVNMYSHVQDGWYTNFGQSKETLLGEVDPEMMCSLESWRRRIE